MTLHAFLDIFLDALKDSALVFPFLMLTYIIIGLLERRAAFLRNGKFLSGKTAPLLGSLAGMFPQCGFSVMAAKLYDKDLIKAGTLLAVFVATSDEAFTVLLTSGKFVDLAALLGCKFLFAVILGYVVNACFKKRAVIKFRGAVNVEPDARQYENTEYKTKWEAYFKYPLIHSLKTLGFIFGVNFVFGLILGFVGEDALIAFIGKQKYIEPFLCALVGLIPNCASSILITQLYVVGGIGFGSLFAGLAVNAGIGLAIILKNRQKIKTNLILLSVLYLYSCGIGVLINLFIKLVL